MPNHYQIKPIQLSVPVNYSQPHGEQITLFAREIYRNSQAPICVFLQGGPGFEAPRDPDSIAWLDFMLQHFRVVLVDQRGTGRSSPIGPELCQTKSEAEQQAHSLRPDLCEYLSQFRADNIVRDLEQLRQRHYQGQRWFLLGQSFGGFISCHYLSVKPDALAGVMICGGLPPMLHNSPAETYRVLVEGVYQRSLEYYRAYPEDRARVKRIVELLQQQPYDLGDNGVMTAQRFLDIGMLLGTTHGFGQLHALLDNPFSDHTEQQLRWAFIEGIRRQSSYETNPLYVLLHEAIYCGPKASHWAAQEAINKHPGFDLSAEEIAFYGETIRPDMLDDYGQLQGFKQTAQQLAEKEDWPPLYSLSQLACNPVPVECIVYEQDFYVDMAASLQTAEAIQGANVWLHPTWQHDALRTQGQAVVEPMVQRLLRRTNPI